ncbi:MAG: 2-dehydro-3-deoxyglucarate aldolase [Pirellulaceae bacterium]|jgi:2-dehydro-3-deoxyglucarate aldolase
MTTFRKRLLNNERLVGTMITLNEPAVAEILSMVGFDWLFVDAEHGPFEISDLGGILQAAGATSCLVRVAATSEAMIKRTLDCGAAGIIVPQVNTAEQAAAVVQYARYAPEGQRGVGLGRAHGYGLAFQQYVDSANDNVVVVVQAEHIDAVNNIESIVQVPGIDAVLLGPYDLSASIGKLGQITDAEVTAAIDRVTAACQAANVPLGIFGVSADALRPYVDKGYSLIVGSTDTLFLGGAATKMLKALRE